MRMVSGVVAEGDQFPGAIRYGHFTTEYIKIAVVRLNFEKKMIGAVPLVNNLFDGVLVLPHAKANRTFTFFVTGVAVDVKPHADIVYRNAVEILP